MIQQTASKAAEISTASDSKRFIMGSKAIIYLIGLGLLAGMIFIAYNIYDGVKTYKAFDNVTRVKVSQRVLSLAIENYQSEFGNYPLHTIKKEEKLFKENLSDNSLNKLENVSCFSNRILIGLNKSLEPGTDTKKDLTDIFSPAAKAPFGYYAKEKGWVLWSAGPDNDYDITYQTAEKLYEPSQYILGKDPLFDFKYDASNGTISSGDIYRVKQ